MFDDWPKESRAVAESLVLLFQVGGADLYELRVPREVRFGWPGKPYAYIKSSHRRVQVRLRVGRNSPLMTYNGGPLEPLPNAKTADHDRDYGRLYVPPVPQELHPWIARVLEWTRAIQ